VHLRLRKGSANTQRGIERFIDELIARVARAGASGVKVLRADSGFWNTKVFERLEQAGWQYSIGVRTIKTVTAALEAIDEDAWQSIDYPEGGEAQIAETTYAGRRLIVRRTRLIGPQAELWPNWRHFALITNRSEEITIVAAEHRAHAVVELVIRDLKDQAMAHFPSGQFSANAAWTVLAALAHNLTRWTELLGLPDRPISAARTLRRRLLALPGRLVSHAGRWKLRLPARSQPAPSRPHTQAGAIVAAPRRRPRRSLTHPNRPLRPRCGQDSLNPPRQHRRDPITPHQAANRWIQAKVSAASVSRL